MPIRVVVFDIGGVLEITPQTGWSARWEAQLGLKQGEILGRLGDVWRAGSLGTISEAEVERSVAERLELDRAQLDALMGDLWEEYLGSPNTELIDYFAGLRPRYRTAILSNSFVGAREREQERYGFGDLCETIIYSHEVGLQKPNRAIYALTCERLGVRPEEMIFLDDAQLCVSAAHAFGIRAIRFNDTVQAIADIEACLISGEA